MTTRDETPTTPSGQIRMLCDDRQMDNIRLALLRDDIGFMAGHYSIYSPKLQAKYVRLSSCQFWPNLDGVMEQMTPTEIARLELKREFPDHKRIGWNRSHLPLLDWRPPMAYTGQYSGRAYHIDLVSAYWQIYRRLWLNVPYPFGFGTLDLAPIAARLEKHKKARNSLIGICTSKKTAFYKNGKLRFLHTRNPYLSPELWAKIQAILNEIAFTAVELGAIYIATDGYIIPDTPNTSPAYFMDLLNKWGFDFRFRWGVVDIRGWQSYRTELKTTKPYKQGMVGGQSPFKNLRLRNDAFMVEQILHSQECLEFKRKVNDYEQQNTDGNTKRGFIASISNVGGNSNKREKEANPVYSQKQFTGLSDD